MPTFRTYLENVDHVKRKAHLDLCDWADTLRNVREDRDLSDWERLTLLETISETIWLRSQAEYGQG